MDSARSRGLRNEARVQQVVRLQEEDAVVGDLAADMVAVDAGNELAKAAPS